MIYVMIMFIGIFDLIEEVVWIEELVVWIIMDMGNDGNLMV